MKFGMEMFGGKKKTTESDVAIEELSIPEADVFETVDNSRRSFLRGGAALAASYVIGKEAEAAGEKFKGQIEYQGFKPSKHEEALINANLIALVPEALSVQITLNAPDSSFGKDVATQNMRMSILLNNGKEISLFGVPSFYDAGVNKNAQMINGLFERLRERLAK